MTKLTQKRAKKLVRLIDKWMCFKILFQYGMFNKTDTLRQLDASQRMIDTENQIRKLLYEDDGESLYTLAVSMGLVDGERNILRKDWKKTLKERFTKNG